MANPRYGEMRVTVTVIADPGAYGNVWRKADDPSVFGIVCGTGLYRNVLTLEVKRGADAIGGQARCIVRKNIVNFSGRIRIKDARRGWIRLFEYFAILTMASWSPITAEELREHHNIELSALNDTTHDLAVAHVSDQMLAVRYTWTLAGSVVLTDVHVFVFASAEDQNRPDSQSSYIERHYRVRADEYV